VIEGFLRRQKSRIASLDDQEPVVKIEVSDELEINSRPLKCQHLVLKALSFVMESTTDDHREKRLQDKIQDAGIAQPAFGFLAGGAEIVFNRAQNVGDRS
jgi:hypothetical protein